MSTLLRLLDVAFFIALERELARRLDWMGL